MAKIRILQDIDSSGKKYYDEIEDETITTIQGPRGFQGRDGEKGEGLPTGGTTGQVLLKKSNTDYDYDWGATAGTGDMLKAVYDTDNNGVVDNSEKVNGIDTAGNSKYYGTDESGAVGFHDVPQGNVTSVNSQTGAVVLDADDIDDTSTTNKFVTATDINNWNAKSDFSGSYSDLTDKPAIPTATSDLTNDSDFLTSETDPLFTAWDKDYADLINKPTIPTALASLTDDATHRLVTDTEKTTWNAKQNALVADTDYLTPTTASTTYEPKKGTDDNYVTDAEKAALHSHSNKTALDNVSGVNTGDQDLSGYALKSNVLAKDNTTSYTPTAEYHPATKDYVDTTVESQIGAATLFYEAERSLSGSIATFTITDSSLPSEPINGTQIFVKFMTGNGTYTTTKLKLNTGSEYPLYFNSSYPAANVIKGNGVYICYFNGTYWDLAFGANQHMALYEVNNTLAELIYALENTTYSTKHIFIKSLNENIVVDNSLSIDVYGKNYIYGNINFDVWPVSPTMTFTAGTNETLLVINGDLSYSNDLTITSSVADQTSFIYVKNLIKNDSATLTIGSGIAIKYQSLVGTGTITGTATQDNWIVNVSIADDSVTNAKLANMAQSTIKGRASGAGTGDPTDLTPTQVRTMINVAEGANNYTHPNHSGDVTSVADGATTIGNGKVTLAKMANLAQNTIIGRITASTGVPQALTATNVRTIINVEDGANNYVHPSTHSADIITDGTTNKAYTATEQTKLAGIATGATANTKATGAEVDTGTDDVKFVTSKAMADSSIHSGWIPANETWSYASATTITVPSGATGKYQKGDKIKLTQTTVKYFYIVGVSDTILTITGGSSYTLINTTISDNYYSHSSNPIGFPQWFALTAPTLDTTAFDNGAGGQPTVSETRFSINGQACTVHFRAEGTKAGTNATLLSFADTSLPLINRANYTGRASLGVLYALIAGTHYIGNVRHESNNNYYGGFSTNINDNSVLTDLSFTITYEI